MKSKIKTDTVEDIETAVAAAMAEMQDDGIPIKSFEPCASGGYDFVFKKGLTKGQQSKAQAIADKWLGGEWTF